MFQKLSIGCVILLLLLIGIQMLTQAVPSWLLQLILWVTIIVFIYYIFDKKRKNKR
ncbi:hypothetical protein GCM10011391_32480 [Pullulanibacillus camelliae]|uniref:Uncharacterized protein n=1 Tax=Pullulanibacillus camelliae TaxID=1707096 RepID=A0A8J2YLK2_9BACL|nr:hypothetical protein [Pullulanibacillus camelliae]GGE51197.1 hypothetical protein GCM10011391_32480 [Pullulanibacillus camelliae]